MLSAVIRNGQSYRAMPLAGQLVHHRSAHPGPLVLGATPLNSPARTLDRDRLFVTRPAGFLFPLAPCVAAGVRPYLLALERVRRMACEDSTSLNRCFYCPSRYSSYLRVHRVGDVHDLEEAFRREVLVAIYTIQHVLECHERLTLYDKPPVAKRDDLLIEVLEVSDDVLQRSVPGSGSRIWRDRAAAQALL